MLGLAVFLGLIVKWARSNNLNILKGRPGRLGPWYLTGRNLYIFTNGLAGLGPDSEDSGLNVGFNNRPDN